MFGIESIKYLVEVLKDDLQRQMRRNHALLPTLQVLVVSFSSQSPAPQSMPIFCTIYFKKQAIKKLVKPFFFRFQEQLFNPWGIRNLIVY